MRSFEDYAVDSTAFVEQYRYWTQYYLGSALATPLARDDLEAFSVPQQIAARHFIGDPVFGYKTSLCARDLAIYTMIFVGSVIYSRYRWRIRPISILLYVLVGLGPVALDGLSQLLSYPPFEFWPGARDGTDISPANRRMVWPHERVAGIAAY